MATSNSSNGSSPSNPDKASSPSPSPPSSEDADSTQSTLPRSPSKSPPPRSPSKSAPPPSPSKSAPPPSPSKSAPPPSQSQSPPPPSPSPPPSPPPPSPSHSPPPSQPPKGSPPPPFQSKAAPPPPSKSSPPSPPPSTSTPTPTQPSPSPPPPPPPSPNSTPPPSPPSHAPQVAPSPPHASPPKRPSKSPSPSPSPSRGSNDVGQNVGIALAGIFILAFVAVVLFFVLRRKEKRGNAYAMPPHSRFHMNGDVHNYHVEKPGVANGSQNGFYGSISTPGNNYGSGSHAGGGMRHMRTHSTGGQIVFSYDTIMEITDGFSSQNVIGQGGFGNVYKASMPDGRVGAIKLLKAGSGQGEREFRAEVEIISRVHHRNLVSLIGYCISEQQRVLIYEFVPNGNLSQHLHESGRPVLDWPKRMKIALGAARGLAYLHEGCNPKIIHRDIKSANILLDDAYEAQVSDFGLARLTDDANTHVSTRVMGTFGYMAPEYATSGKLTDRSDVFSFGVVLLELITGRKPVDPTQPVGDESLVEWARPLLPRAIETGDFGELVDLRLEGCYVESEMSTMIDAAAACVRHSAPKRPRMVQVARALDSEDQLYDLSNGVKYGHSTIYDSGQYNEDIMRFRRLANGSFSDSEFDMYSTEYSSREMSTIMRCSSSGDSEMRALHIPSSSTEHRS